MQLEVYQTDAEAYEAAAALAAGRLVAAAAAGPASIALPGGRGGRALMLALAGRDDIPWDRIDVYFTDECCLPEGDARRTLVVARQSLLSPRGIAADHVHAMVPDGRDATAAATAYGALLRGALGAPPVLDLVVLDLGADGGVAAVAPGNAAARSTEPVAAVDAAELGSEPRVARVTLTLVTLRAARHAIVTATGAGRAAAVAAALREPADVERRPAQALLPSESVSWFVDRAAADLLLRDARPVAAGD
ncbi:MAG TPA: 6-phosphogluconolactonase [Candidatus Binatia bacterium]|nr:6-phosphogluconolactonase [Candidatus Binatia bacterium]